MDINELKNHALNIRRNIVQMVYDAQSGHPGGSLGCADILTYLYFVEMDINKENADSTERDRFVLSKGHCSPALYATLQEAGLIQEDLSTFRQINSNLQGHPNMKVPGVDMSTGSLGQGVSTAVGMAIANKLDDNGHRVYALVGDGESEEGIVWEALMAACHYKLDDLCVIFDLNHLQIDGNVQDVIGPLPLKEKRKRSVPIPSNAMAMILNHWPRRLPMPRHTRDCRRSSSPIRSKARVFLTWKTTMPGMALHRSSLIMKSQ